MNQSVKVTAKAFADLVNPYTGLPVEVMMMTTKTGVPKFYAPKTYSTHQYFGSRAAAYAAWCRSLGIDDVRKGQPVVCAYTGEPLRLVKDEYGFHYEGGFDPRRFYTRAEFLYFATMRNGVSKYGKPGEDRKLESVKEPSQRQVLHHEVQMIEGAEEHAAQAMAAAHFEPEKRTVVSMATHAKKGRTK